MNPMAGRLPLVGPRDSIRQAMQVIDATAKGIALVGDECLHLLGVITDGDIRRAILSGTDLSTEVTKLLIDKQNSFCPKPITAREETPREDLLELMQRFSVRQIPLLDKEGRIAGLVKLEELLPDYTLPVRAVILAECGRSEHDARNLPKPMLPVGNRPLMELVIGQLRKVGIRHVCLVSSLREPTIERHFGDGKEWGIDLRYAYDSQLPGTFEGVEAPEAAELPWLVLNGGVLTRVDFQAMLQYHCEHQADLTVAVQAQAANQDRELIETDGKWVKGIREPSHDGHFVNAGIYLLAPDVCRRLGPVKSEELPVLIRQLVAEGRTVVRFPIREYWVNIGSLEDYQRLLADEQKGLLGDFAATSLCYEAGIPPPPGVIPLCVPEIRGNEWRYVKECLDTKWVSTVGPFVDSFEKMVADYVGVDFGVATCNGTSALHTALLIAGVQPDEEVLVSTLTFIAPVNAIRYIGAWPVFIDSEPDYWQMDPQKLIEFLTERCGSRNGALFNKATGRRIRAVLPVHILGHPCDMDPILAAARNYGLVVIEDASESLGAEYKGHKVGSLGDVACFSFNGNKILTTGGGGMVVTNNEAWAQRAKYLTTQAKDDPLEYVHRQIGYNYRLTNVQAAMGCAQMEQLDGFVERKRAIAHAYIAAFAGTPGITIPREASWSRGSCWLCTVQVHEPQFGINSRELLKRLSDADMQSRPLWHPIHSLPPYRKCEAYRIEVADALYASALSLPCSVGLTLSDQALVIDVVRGCSRPPLPVRASVGQVMGAGSGRD